MWGSVRAEVIKQGRRPATWLLVGVWLTLGTMFAYVFPYASYRSGEPAGPDATTSLEGLLPADLVVTGISGLPMFGGAIALVLGALAAGGEYGFGALKTTLTQRPGRITVYAGKWVVLAAVLLVMVASFLVLSAGVATVIALVESAPVTWPTAADVLTGLAGGWLVAAMWCGIGVLAAVLTRNTALAVGLGLVWALVVENLLRALGNGFETLRGVTDLMPGTNAGSLVAALGAAPASEADGTPGVVAAVTGGRATLTVAAYLLVLAVAGAVSTRRRDVL